MALIRREVSRELNKRRAAKLRKHNGQIIVLKGCQNAPYNYTDTILRRNIECGSGPCRGEKLCIKCLHKYGGGGCGTARGGHRKVKDFAAIVRIRASKVATPCNCPVCKPVYIIYEENKDASKYYNVRQHDRGY